jgi:hypothetical protein
MSSTRCLANSKLSSTTESIYLGLYSLSFFSFSLLLAGLRPAISPLSLFTSLVYVHCLLGAPSYFSSLMPIFSCIYTYVFGLLTLDG